MKKSIFVFSDGIFRRKDNTLYFESNDGKKFLPVEDIKEIYVFGEVDLNKKFLELCSQKEILLHYFNYHGYYTGTFYPREHLNSGYMTVAQVRHYIDEEARLLLAKKFVQGAVRNIQQVLRYYCNRGKNVHDYLDAIEKLSRSIEDVDAIHDLMALEGNVREQYYHAFDVILDREEFRFETRSRRPPQNELNTLISFGNSILYTMVLSEIYKTHLDPRIGYLHTTNFRRFTLNLDVAEIFKPVLIDRLIFMLIGKKMIQTKDFERESGGMLLTERGKKIFVTELDRKLQTTIHHRGIGNKVSYRRLLRLELYKLEKHFMGEKEYEPFLMRW